MQIRKRRVFYISGFDPRGVAAYHRLYTDESRAHSARFGTALQVGARRRESELSSAWSAIRDTEAGKVETTFEFLHWDDIVRRHWQAGYHRLYVVAAATYWRWLVQSRFLARLFRFSKWNFVTAVAPFFVLFLLAPLALLAGWAGYVAAAGAAAQPWSAALAGCSALAAALACAWGLERFFRLGWLLRTFGFVLDYSKGRVPELRERVERFAERIAGYVAGSDDDEIIVVGHSVGANVAVAVLASALLRDGSLFCRRAPVAFLTLGGSIPLQGMLPWAGDLRDALARVAAAEEICWVDITASQDVASFANASPLRLSGVAADDGPPPVLVSGGFRERLAPEHYERASWDVFRMHFQYLMASEREWPNDYLSLTSDALPFRERFSKKP